MAGAAVTISGGSFSSNSVTAGTGFVNGSAYGADLFLGNNVTFNVTNGTTLTLNGLGGAGNTNDPNVNQYNGYMPQSNTISDPNAQGGIIKTGSGSLVLAGTNYYSGATVIHQGTVVLAPGAVEKGTANVIIGQNSGDNGTLVLNGGSVLTGQGPLILSQTNGANGMLVFAGNSVATLNGFSAITSVGTNGTVQFAPSVGSTFTFDTSRINGGTTLTQNGPGTTMIQPPPSATGTFGGSLFVMQGTLQIGTPNAIGFWNPIFVQGGTLDLYQYNLSQRTVFLSSGTILSSQNGANYYPLLELDYLSTVSGTVNVSLNCGPNFQLTQDGAGTTVLTANNMVSNSTINIMQGQLQISQRGGLLNGQLNDPATIQVTGTGSFNVQGSSSSPNNGILNGAQMVIVGKNSGDNATMQIDGNVLGSGSLVLGQWTGSTGTVTVGASSAKLEFSTITGGDSGGELIFGETTLGTAAVGKQTINSLLTGNLTLIVDTPNTIYLRPLNGQYAGQNSYTGSTIISNGVLQLAGLSFNSSLPGSGTVQIHAGGELDINGSSSTIRTLELQGGLVADNATTKGILSPSSILAQSGIISAAIGGTGSLTQDGSGTTTITASTSFSGATTINQGTLVAGVSGALGGTTNVAIATGGTLVLGASNSVNSSASLALIGGKLGIASNLTQTLGVWTLLNSSTLDFSGYAASLTFTSLSVNGIHRCSGPPTPTGTGPPVATVAPSAQSALPRQRGEARRARRRI
jgi:autotransporter-associated beta strand protein